jgi:hypothetical protein
MSRAYRVSVSDRVRRVIRGKDHIKSQLEILEILPCEEMIDLLAAELEKEGFLREGNAVSLKEGNVKVDVDLENGEVTVTSELAKEVEESGTESGWGYDDGPAIEGGVRQTLRRRLNDNVNRKEEELQKEATDALEGALADIRQALDKAVNRATAEALKQKAARLGQIKEVTEDGETGSLTIVVEV